MLSPAVLAQVGQFFGPTEQARVVEALSRYRGNAAERVHTVILKAAKGDVAKICALVDAANLDFRDVLSIERSRKEKITAFCFVALVILAGLLWRVRELF